MDAEGPIYPAREDSRLLSEFAHVARGATVLEIGAGSGIASLIAARAGARVVATDLNPHALRRLAARARLEELDLAVVRTDLARGLGRFDRILANPPYLPTRPLDRDPDRWQNLALDGGADGMSVTARIVDALPGHLATGGSAYVVGSSLQEPAAVRAVFDRWRRNGGRVELVASRTIGDERIEVHRFDRPSARGPGLA